MKLCPICHNRKMQGKHVCRVSTPAVNPIDALTSYPNGMSIKQELAELRATFASLIYRLSEREEDLSQ